MHVLEFTLFIVKYIHFIYKYIYNCHFNQFTYLFVIVYKI